ncbi:MAG: cobalt ECF transporter T component CbiQ [Desulfobacteraceae bacterium 4572_123]|nr:MAG: cobalt ECF transporter T component CbiQ [Desulfobacteraceae bacterium 4572_123]
MITEPFAIGNSWIHRIDPRLKIVFATLYSFIIALSDRFPTLFAGLVISISLVVMARLNIRRVSGRLAVVSGFFLLLWIVMPLTYEGPVMYRLGPLAFTRPGIILSSKITLKSISILLAFMALVATMTFATLGYALDRLHISGKLVHLFLLTYRYIFVIEQEYQRLMRAARIRNFCPGTNMHSYKTYAYIIGMLFVRASARARRVHQAMLCRGFKGRFYCLREFKSARCDWFFLILMALISTGLIYLQWIY